MLQTIYIDTYREGLMTLARKAVSLQMPCTFNGCRTIKLEAVVTKDVPFPKAMRQTINKVKRDAKRLGKIWGETVFNEKI